MPATAATTEPFAFTLSSVDARFVIASALVVALVSVAFVAKRLPIVAAVEEENGMMEVERPLTLRTPLMVVEPFTKSALVVAPVVVKLVMMAEVAPNDVVVPFWKEKLMPVVRPVLEMLKRVEVAQREVEDAMVKRLSAWVVVVGDAPIAKSAAGVVVPIPMVPALVMVVVAVVPIEALDAVRPPLKFRRVEVAFAGKR